MRILYAYADQPKEWNCSEHRCMVPAREIMRTKEHVADTLHIGDLVTEQPYALVKASAADLIIYQRNALFKVLIDAEKWRAKGKAVVVDLDDGYHVMPPTIGSYDFWINGYIWDENKKRHFATTPVEQLEAACKWMDGVVTPSKVIQLDWENRYVRNTYLVNNYLENSVYQRARTARPTRDDFLVIGWGGSHTHVESFMESGVSVALRRILEKRPVKLVLGGSNTQLLKRMQLPFNKVIDQHWVSYADWPKVLATFDIGIAPLAGQYDRRRSWLKVAEYCMAGIPWIATDGEPYQSLREFGTLIPNKASAWEQALNDMIDNYTERVLIAEKNIEKAIEVISIERNVGKVLDTYQKIIETSKKA